MDLDNRHIVEQTANFYRMALATGLTAHGYLTRQVSVTREMSQEDFPVRTAQS